jgi:hypothetical protein
MITMSTTFDLSFASWTLISNGPCTIRSNHDTELAVYQGAATPSSSTTNFQTIHVRNFVQISFGEAASNIWVRTLDDRATVTVYPYNGDLSQAPTDVSAVIDTVQTFLGTQKNNVVLTPALLALNVADAATQRQALGVTAATDISNKLDKTGDGSQLSGVAKTVDLLGLLPKTGDGSGLQNIVKSIAGKTGALTFDDIGAASKADLVGLAQDTLAAITSVNQDVSGKLDKTGGTIAGTVTIKPSGQGLGVILNQSLSGTATGALSGNYFELTDTAVASAPDVTTFWNMSHVINAGVQGHRGTFQLVTTINAADNGVTQNPYYVTFAPATVVNAGDNGTVDGSTGKVSYSSGRGAYFVGNPVLKAFNAPNIQELSVYEFNISADANTSVAYKSLLALVPLASDKSQGTIKDDMITLSAQPGAVGFRNLINISSSHGAMPVNSGTTVLRVGPGTISTGIDMSATTISGNAFASPGFRVLGYGALQLDHQKPIMFDVGGGINPGTHGAQIQASVGNVYLDNWDGGFIYRTTVVFRKEVGFNGATPVGKQTISAALPTDGTATNALITLGLAQ